MKHVRLLVTMIMALFMAQIFTLSVVTTAAGAAVSKKPKIIIIPTCEASNPYQLKMAAEEVSNLLDVQLCSVNMGYLPSAEGIDLSAYDAVFVVGNAPQTFSLNQAIEKAKKKTTVIVVAPVMVEGNVKLAEHPWLEQYWFNRCQENFKRLMVYLGATFCGLKAEAEKPVIFPKRAIYHPDSETIFYDLQGYLSWYDDKKAGGHHIYDPKAPTLGVIFHRTGYTKGTLGAVNALIKKIEDRGCNVIAMFGKDGFEPSKFFIKDGRTIVDSIILQASQLNYLNYEKGISEAKKVNVAFLQGLTHWYMSPQEWEKSPQGLALNMTPQLVYAERDGVFEPIVIAGKVMSGEGRGYNEPIDYQIDWRVDRAIAWARLHRMKNSDKKIAVTYYSEGGGKSNVGADIDYYLDAQASLINLFKAMKSRGYNLGETPPPDLKALSDLMAERGSNVGVWAPGELMNRIKQGNAISIPEEKYREWFNELPEDKRKSVIERWGKPPGKIMVYEEGGKKYIVIPKIQFGNIILLPHPTWGFMQDKDVLYYKGAIPPHHEYIAFYSWLNKEFKADALFTIFTQMSLMPGKQEGPSRYDWAGILLQNMPHIHPFPIQANGGLHNKRRANALIIDYMPTIVSSGLYEDLLVLQKKLAIYDQKAEGALHEEYKKGIISECKRLKLDKDLKINLNSIRFEDLIVRLNRYLNDIKKEHMPYGGHILSEPPQGDALVSMVTSMLGEEFKKHIARLNPEEGLPERLVSEIILKARSPEDVQNNILGQVSKDITKNLNLAMDYAKRIDGCRIEIPRILDAFEGKYIIPGPMDDPIRNPDSIPTGRNPYTFDTRSMPTREAWEIGKQMVDQMIEQHLKKTERYPRKMAFVLWSSETTKHHGVMESQVLYLMGIKPVWDKKGYVTDVELINRSKLKRPRIDVMVTTSGTYRDHFQDKIELIDRAVQLAAGADEPLNFVRSETEKLKGMLLSAGHKKSEAGRLSTARIFSEAMGAYSPNIQFAISAGNTWEDDKKISDLYISRMSYAYGRGMLGENAKKVFKENLKGVEAGVFSRSSNVYGALEHPMVAAYFGGLKMAIRNTSGKKIEMYITNLRDSSNTRVETMDHFYNRELRSRYFNPKWIKGMMKHGYDGARYMEAFTENLWVWDVTSPEMVTEDNWNEVNNVYIDDKYDLKIQEYFDKNNPYALQSMISTMLEVREKGYWHPSKEVLEKLAKIYAESIAKHGVACSYGTCADPSLHKDVSRLLSAMPDVKPELIKKYQENIDKATVKLEQVKGYEMKEEQEKKEEKISAPKVALAAIVIVLLIMVVVGRGLWKGMRGQQ